MNSILQAFLNFGIGGAMALTVIWFVMHLTQDTIPRLLKQVDQSRADFAEALRDQQHSFSQSLSSQRQDFAELLDRIEAKWANEIRQNPFMR